MILNAVNMSLDITDERAFNLNKKILDFTIGGKDANEKELEENDLSIDNQGTQFYTQRKRKIEFLKEDLEKIATIKGAMKDEKYGHKPKHHQKA